MKQLAAGILGAISVLLTLTLFGSLSFSCGFILYAAALYLLFYAPYQLGLSFLIGITVGYEALGGQHFGEATLLLFVVLLTFHFFGERLRFTSQYTRYIVGLLLVGIVYSILMFSLQHFFGRAVPLLISYLLCIVVTYPLSSRSKSGTHEFLRPLR